MLFLNAFILLFMEGCMEIVISAYINLYSNLFYTFGDKFSYYFSYACLFLTIVVLPAGLIFVMNVRIQAMKSSYWSHRFGSIYEGIKVENTWSRCYNLFQVLRRLLFLFVVFHPGFELAPSLQIMSIVYITLFMNAY